MIVCFIVFVIALCIGGNMYLHVETSDIDASTTKDTFWSDPVGTLSIIFGQFTKSKQVWQERSEMKSTLA